MKSSDPASLQNLNDIVMPATVGWWPLATGWYILSGLLLIGFAWFGYRLLQHWMRNRYRRTALSELKLLANRIDNPEERDAGLRQIPVLLKRTALSVYPRYQVASLTGTDWHQFLNSKLKQPLFTESIGKILDKAAYSTGGLQDIDQHAATSLLGVSRLWLQLHQFPQDGSGS